MIRANSRSVHVLLALAVVFALAGSLAWRASAGSPTPTALTAPAAMVPAPKPIRLEQLEVPCWGCREAIDWPLRSRFDLDHLAPLGNGNGNAGVWLRDFAKVSGRRAGELVAVRARTTEGPANLGKVLPGDDPFLAEAEPWADQATLRFYPELLRLEGADTEIPDLLIALTLAKSWVARGRLSADPAAALEDFRRALRWGRLLRQEDVTIIADLVGMACVRIATEAIFEHGRDHDDPALALAASIALGEIGPQRLLTSERITRVALQPTSTTSGSLVLSEEKLTAIEQMAGESADRRFRGEAIIDLGFVYHLAAAPQRERSGALLQTLSADRDPIVASAATWAVAHPPTAEILSLFHD